MNTNSIQGDLFGHVPSEPTGEELRDIGIAQAVGHAESKHEGWADAAFSFLLSYMREHHEFMGEDVRNASYGHVPEAPSNRAWGGIMRRAAKEGLIYRIGFQSVKNPKAHCAPCSVWKVVN